MGRCSKRYLLSNPLPEERKKKKGLICQQVYFLFFYLQILFYISLWFLIGHLDWLRQIINKINSNK